MVVVWKIFFHTINYIYLHFIVDVYLVNIPYIPDWVVLWNLFLFHTPPFLGRWSNLTIIFFKWVGKNHQLVIQELVSMNPNMFFSEISVAMRYLGNFCLDLFPVEDDFRSSYNKGVIWSNNAQPRRVWLLGPTLVRLPPLPRSLTFRD